MLLSLTIAGCLLYAVVVVLLLFSELTPSLRVHLSATHTGNAICSEHSSPQPSREKNERKIRETED